ncbi:MAG: aminotransferase class I/II-fold pyridoxal phosphate-dependent enzyme [Chloroflexota bacterium]
MPTNFDNIPNRRRPGHLNRWTLHPNLVQPLPKEVVSMWLADMDFPAPKPILDALYGEVRHGVFGYDLPSPELLEVVATRMDRLYNWKIKPEMIIALPGTISGLSVAARAFCSPERGIMVQTPVYNHFLYLEKNIGVPLHVAPFVKSVDGNILHYEIDWDLFEQQVKRAGMFLLCNPHNPLGIVFSGKELARMADICIRNAVLIVSDEIHAELLLDDNKFTPIGRLSSDIGRSTISLVAASKAFNVPGLHCGFAIIPNKSLRDRFVNMVERLDLLVPSLGLVAARAAFSGRCDGWLMALRRYLTENRNFLLSYVTEFMPEVRTTIPQATYLGWLDFTATAIQGSPFEFFMKEAKVALSDGKIFGKEGEGHVRINFGTSRRILEQGLSKMRRALEKI